MTKPLRIGVLVTMFAMSALTLGDATLAKSVKIPGPPPPVLCGCICPDGSFTTTHAPNPRACPSACARACDSGTF